MLPPTKTGEEPLSEEDLVALSDAALHLIGVAKAQNARRRDLASCMAQVDDWEARHTEAVAGTEGVPRAVAALRDRIDAGETDREGVSAALDLVERYLAAVASYRATHKELKQAAADADFEAVSSLNETLKSLGTERDQARATLDEVPSKPHPAESTPTKPTTDRATAAERETTNGADSPEELKPATDQAEPSTLVASEREEAGTTDDAGAAEDETESTTGDSTEAKEEAGDGQPDAEQDGPPRPDDGKANTRGAADPASVDDEEEESAPSIADAIAMSIDRARFALAYHLSLSVPEALPSPTAIKLAAYNYVTEERSPMAAELSELAATLHHEAEAVADEGAGWRSHVLFTTCAALAPALSAPGGPVAQLLGFFEPWLDPGLFMNFRLEGKMMG